MGKRAASASVDVRCSHGKCHLKDNNGGRCCRRSPQSSEKFAFFFLAPLGAAFKVELKFKLLWKCASAARLPGCQAARLRISVSIYPECDIIIALLTHTRARSENGARDSLSMEASPRSRTQVPWRWAQASSFAAVDALKKKKNKGFSAGYLDTKVNILCTRRILDIQAYTLDIITCWMKEIKHIFKYILNSTNQAEIGFYCI